jgi:hypothetical protein
MRTSEKLWARPGDDVLLYFQKSKLKATYNYRHYLFHHGIEFSLTGRQYLHTAQEVSCELLSSGL